MATAQMTEASTSKFVETGAVSDNIKIHYNEAGTGDPLIFLHGSGPGASSWSNFARNVGPLSEDYRCILMDQPGYGKSGEVVLKADQPRSIVNSRGVIGLMDALGLQKASLVGNSMGGATALNVALDHPDRVDKLILMGSGSGGVNIFAHLPSEGIKILNDLFINTTLDGFRRLINVMLYDGESVPDEILKQRYETAMANQQHLENRNKSNNTQRDISSDLGKITHPTLIIHGRNDRVVPLEGSLRLLAGLPNSRLEVFNKCGHWAQFEHAGLFNRLLKDFLNND